MGLPQDPRRTGGLGIKIAASTVWEILKVNGIDPARHRAGPTWPQFLRSQADAILASDLFTVDLLDGTQACVLAVIEHATRRIRILGVTLRISPGRVTRIKLSAPTGLPEAALEPVQRFLGDLVPAMVDREGVPPVGELPEVGDRG